MLLGPNGSGKSTVFDVFAFLSESFLVGLRPAWERRNRFKELHSRGSKGPIEFELKYRETPGSRLLTYHLEINEDSSGPVVTKEWLQWKRGSYGRLFKFPDFTHGEGGVISGEDPDESALREPESLRSPDLLAVSALGS